MLSIIARAASHNDVVRPVSTTSRQWDNVINGQLALFAAVITFAVLSFCDAFDVICYKRPFGFLFSGAATMITDGCVLWVFLPATTVAVAHLLSVVVAPPLTVFSMSVFVFQVSLMISLAYLASVIVSKTLGDLVVSLSVALVPRLSRFTVTRFAPVNQFAVFAAREHRRDFVAVALGAMLERIRDVYHTHLIKTHNYVILSQKAGL